MTDINDDALPVLVIDVMESELEHHEGDDISITLRGKAVSGPEDGCGSYRIEDFIGLVAVCSADGVAVDIDANDDDTSSMVSEADVAEVLAVLALDSPASFKLIWNRVASRVVGFTEGRALSAVEYLRTTGQIKVATLSRHDYTRTTFKLAEAEEPEMVLRQGDGTVERIQLPDDQPKTCWLCRGSGYEQTDHGGGVVGSIPCCECNGEGKV